MRNSGKSILIGLTAVTFLVVAGCQKGGDGTQPPTASVNGPGSEKGKIGADGLPENGPIKSDQDPLHPVVVVETSLGNFTLKLDAEKAPLTTDNFLSYVANHHYDQTIFHQVLKEYPRVILGGAFTADLVEKKARTPIRNEAHNGLKNRRGTIAMARKPDSEDSATCHFFINVADNDVLNYKDRTPQGYGYCVFGEVTEGLETIDRIGQAAVRDADKFERIPVETVLIKSVRRTK